MMNKSLPLEAAWGGGARLSRRLDDLTNEIVWTPAGLDFLTSRNVQTQAPKPRLGVAATADSAKSKTPFPTGRKLDEQIFTFLPTGRKNINIPLDIY
jgi:hypothetical protein